MLPSYARKRLQEMKAELIALSHAAADNRKPVALDQQSVGRLSRMDSLQVQAMDKAQEAARAKILLRIEAALERAGTDDFGYCVTCEQLIAEKRLEFDPSTPLCIDCAKVRT